MYQPALWHDYFAVVGTGAAALTGLVFVAMTLHLEEVTGDPVHRHRARTILTGLTAVFIRCALVLMGGQNAQAIAVEIIGVLLVVEAILYNSIRQAARSADHGVLWRASGRFACLLLRAHGDPRLPTWPTRLGAATTSLLMPAPINGKPADEGAWGITMNGDTKRPAPKSGSVTRARLRASEVVTTIRRCSERPTN